MDTEKQPLLRSSSRSSHLGSGTFHHSGSSSVTKADGKKEVIKLKRHITLPYAVAIIVGNVVGSGIFLSPKGVTQNIGSVGASLIVWGATGLYNLAQALCYAELGAMIPKSGGDYAYLYHILGPLPAFLCAWVHVLIIASSSCAVISRTAALYLIEPLGLNCNISIITLLALFIIITLATVNGLSSRWGTKVQTIFTTAKLIALAIIIVAGIVKMAQGNTQNFQNAFEGTSTDPGSIALSVLDGYFAYKGWELINALPEEMVNPQRDLSIAVWISMLLVTVVYVLTNMAYFSVLSPSELLQSDAVALTFADQTLGVMSWIIPIFVALSCMGAVNGDFLSNSRYLFAGGRFKQIPQLFSMIHIRLFTPVPAVAALCVFALLYCVITDLQVLQEYASLTVQLKMMLCLIALFYLRWKKPHVHRPVKVNTVVAILTTLVMIALIVLSFYKSPQTTGIGVGVFCVGIPAYFLMTFVRKRELPNRIMDKVTVVVQKILLIVPETKTKDDDDSDIIIS